MKADNEQHMEQSEPTQLSTDQTAKLENQEHITCCFKPPVVGLFDVQQYINDTDMFARTTKSKMCCSGFHIERKAEAFLEKSRVDF